MKFSYFCCYYLVEGIIGCWYATILLPAIKVLSDGWQYYKTNKAKAAKAKPVLYQRLVL